MSDALNVSRALKNPGQAYPFEAQVDVPEMVIFSDPIRLADATATGECVATGDGNISVRADAAANVHAHCCRCLEPVVVRVEAPVDALFCRVPDPEDPDLYAYEGQRIDLTDAVKDALVLALPMRFYCREDCRGLCPVCGANRNLVTCTCQEGGESANPFSALKNIVLNDEEV